MAVSELAGAGAALQEAGTPHHTHLLWQRARRRLPPPIEQLAQQARLIVWPWVALGAQGGAPARQQRDGDGPVQRPPACREVGHDPVGCNDCAQTLGSNVGA